MRILIAVDDSECSAAAVEEVQKREWGSAVECRIITIVEPIMVGTIDPMYALSMVEAEQEHLSWLEKMIQKEMDRLKESLRCKVTGAVLKGDIADSIVEEAVRWKADLIVVGSHGKKGVQKFILGSVSEKVATGAPCLVEIVKIKKPEVSETKSAHEVSSIPC